MFCSLKVFEILLNQRLKAKFESNKKYFCFILYAIEMNIHPNRKPKRKFLPSPQRTYGTPLSSGLEIAHTIFNSGR